MCREFFVIVLLGSLLMVTGKSRHHSAGKQGFKLLKGIGHLGIRSTAENAGLWPSVFNLATKAVITANATCGEKGREEFCRMVENGRGRCGVCDNFSPDPGKRHPIQYAIDGSNRWWQSPALYYGNEYEFVTITIDLKQVYQVVYVIIKAANSPRPGNWILERSLDGKDYEAWQYYAVSDKECLDRYGIPGRKGKPHYDTDSEVICTSFYSKLTPMENGEIHTSLIHGRPGANETSPELLEFTKARFVRLRLQGLRGAQEPLPKWFSQDIMKDKRLFYSIRDISIGGQCVCNGHAESCRHNVASGHPECECSHHTCGSNCETCCPLYNQQPWGPATSRDARKCIPCNCHGHATSCHYDEAVDRAGLSLDVDGNYQGGGVCDNCTAHTTGINCELCTRGYFRPNGVTIDSENPCLPCACDPLGSTGSCVQEGDHAGVCECRPGFTGPKCDSCAAGFRGYPGCEPCPCDSKGSIVGDDCEGECVCKANVEGKFCDRCKSGHFALQTTNSEGCTPCYCSGVTTLCESALLTSRTFESLQDWLITDLKVTTIEKPTPDERGMLTIGNYELPGVEAYYWLAPKLYLGNKLETYGSYLVFKVHWVVMRGDTSGKPTQGPNLILVGANGMQIAYGDDVFSETNMTFKVEMVERGWYHVPSDVKDIVTRLRRAEYKGDQVKRQQFLDVLANIKYIMLRATFHTDQIECSLEKMTLHIGSLEAPQTYSVVEKCSCPSGYSGLSCESCSYGYMRMTVNDTSQEPQSFCLKCDCNGHSEGCNLDTGECFCEHHTIGERCERCAAGYYGNPLHGTPYDCKRCACPLENEENNFSPSCQLDYSDGEAGISYVCTQCPKGYTGDHCEICDNGYFGDPTELGGSCQPCTCNGGPCDTKTGQCLSCKGNTEGFKCERCKQFHFGDPITSNCQPCLCDPLGSLSKECDNATGQCQCKERFIGRTCDRCEEGFGNVTAFCAPCQCNLVGSSSDICDPHTGVCECQPGVEGFHCDACQHLHYGFSEAGCQSCRCNPRGSEITSCDIVTGQCRCKPNYTGLQCDTCLPGFWDSPSEGCTRCSCDPTGSTDTNCNKHGQCHCKPGVGGLRCDICIDKFYGFSQSGCKPCQPCNEAGHICDPDSGACVCPPLREGHSCQNCVKNTWLLRNNTCMACGCSETGSVKTQCNVKTGQCSCKQGYTGDKCDRCSHGYYGYPTCKRCNCNPMGTDRGYCDSEGICQCRQDGYCPCKSNVVGRRCNTCKEGTFGLDMENSDGCTKCFCFGRSSKCDEAGLTWEKELASDRTLTISHNSAHQGLTSNDVNPLVEIPSHPTDITLYSPAEAPLYWVLPFKGDLVSSYGGYLRFKASTSDHNSPQQFPRVQIQGKETTIESYTLRHDEIKLHESQWTERNRPITREQLMVVLQSVQKILVKATETVQFTNVSLSNVSLDVGRYFKGRPPPRALSVEKCECPKEYEGTSCQDPNVGYFRYFGPPHDPEFSWIDRVVGTAKPCECNGLSSVCERETGHCLNCSDNRAGRHCESCAEGFYMDDRSFCLPCGCPYETLNFAKSCKIRNDGSFSCFCKKGYEGERCEICSRGYYGNPLQENGSCEPCNCNLVGSISNDCDFHTGNCLCKPGFTGKYCSQCEAYRHVIQNQRCLPCDDCTQMLLNELDIISYDLNNSTLHLQGGIKPPWEKLAGYQRNYENLKNRFGNYENKKDEAYDLIQSGNLNLLSDRVQSLKERLNGKENEVNEVANRADNLSGSSANLLGEINGIKTKLNNINTMLNKFGTTHETTKSALRKGRNWLKEIKEIQSQFKSKDEYDAILGSCDKILTQVTYLNESVTKPVGVKHRLDDLKNRIDDLGTLLTEIEKLQNTVNEANSENERRILNLTEQLAPYQDIGTVTSGLEGAETLKEQIQQLIDSTQNNYDALRNNNTIKLLLEELGKRESNLKEKNPLLEDYLLKVKQHVKQLEENASKYNRILDVGNEEWKKSINAYDDLIRNIKEAEEAALTAREELEKAYSIMHPIGGDSISDKASLSYADSTRMLARMQNNQDMPDIRGIPIAIATANLDLQSNGKMNNDQTAKIRHMANNVKIVDLYGVIQKAIDQSAQMQKVYQKVLDINYKKHHELGRDYHKYLNLTSVDELNGLTKKINFAREKLHYIIEQNSTYFQHIKDINGKFHSDNSRFKSISDRMDELKAKIQRARQTADSIKVSLAGQTCHMKYLLEEMEPTVHFNISVRITMAKENVAWKEKRYSLFHVENQKGSQISLEIFNHSVTFTWRFKDTQKNLVVTADDINNVTEINVERVTNGITLSVTNETGYKKSQWLNETASVLYLTRKDLVEVGRNTGLPGCIRDILWNGGRIGFWAFKEKQGDCRGCERIADEQTSQNFFDGTGYAQIKNKLKRKDNLGIIFEINTLDENALILLIPENRSLNNKSECTSFIALSLNDGRIQAEIHYQNKDPLILLTDKRYNTGTTKKVQFTRESSRGADLIKVDDNKASTSQFSPMKSNDISFYLGGVPTEYLLDPDVNSCRPQHTAEGLVGTLNSIQMTPALVGTINLSQGTSVGVSLAINKVVYRRVWFSGKGYLILKSKPEKLNSLKFVIRTQMSSGFILSIEGLLHVYLENKTLHVKGTDGIPHAVSYKDISDGDYHFVEIVNGENLTVDEEAGSLVEFNGDKKRIIIGSSPDIPGNFTGGLKDITVNNRVVEFTNDTIEEFRGAKIGRKWEELPEKVVTGTAHIDKDVNTLNEMKDSQDTGCQRVDIVPERNAAKFGDTLNEASFTLHMLKSSLWKSNYVIEFDLRTFYPDGLIFLIKNPKKLNYYLLKIREGILLLQIKIGKNTTTLKMERKINDGIWHHVTIKYDKKNKEIQMSIDRTRMKSTIIKKNKKNFRELYIGGLPDTSKDLKRLNEDLEIHQFRGCINNLKINSENKSIVGNETKHNKIGQCFASIESGSYFPGDAYAVYSNHFTVNKILELNFEFKTSELYGILLSMSGEGDKPALSLELQNGAIVMTIDSGQGPVSNVTNDLSKHPLCNNSWHNVTALYINSELTVNVDGISKTWVVQEEAGVEMTAPLYIGGLPDDAPTGTLKIKENFKGCMRNIKIGVEPKDWTDMDELNNVLLNSCPAAA